MADRKYIGAGRTVCHRQQRQGQISSAGVFLSLRAFHRHFPTSLHAQAGWNNSLLPDAHCGWHRESESPWGLPDQKTVFAPDSEFTPTRQPTALCKICGLNPPFYFAKNVTTRYGGLPVWIPENILTPHYPERSARIASTTISKSNTTTSGILPFEHTFSSTLH